MAQDWQVPGDAICPDEPTCMYCGKICETTETIYTGDDESYEGFELWCWCDDCQTDTFHKMIKDTQQQLFSTKNMKHIEYLSMY
jgi:hypothetical protein